MQINGKPLVKVEVGDLQSLISNGVMENKSLDYKRSLPGNSDSDKKKYLCDVAAFANSSGGVIIFGIDEDQGLPTNIIGIKGIDPDQEILRLQGLILNGIAPRLTGIEFKTIALPNGETVILLGIPRSWASPHMVTFQGASLFYSRVSSQNYQLDVGELRQAFLQSETISERIRNFRLDRLSRLNDGETPVNIAGKAKILIHYIPLSTFQTKDQIDISFANENNYKLEPIYGSVSGSRFNLEGLVTYSLKSENTVSSYNQLFRNGIVEAVDSLLLSKEINGNPSIPIVTFEQSIVKLSSKILGFQRQLGLEPPIFIFLSLLGVKGYILGLNRELVFDSIGRLFNHGVDRDVLIFPELILESFDVGDLYAFFQPLYDAVWNSAGWPKSLNYDDNNVYRFQR